MLMLKMSQIKIAKPDHQPPVSKLEFASMLLLYNTDLICNSSVLFLLNFKQEIISMRKIVKQHLKDNEMAFAK